jgi:hypothetical protein
MVVMAAPQRVMAAAAAEVLQVQVEMALMVEVSRVAPEAPGAMAPMEMAAKAAIILSAMQHPEQHLAAAAAEGVTMEALPDPVQTAK